MQNIPIPAGFTTSITSHLLVKDLQRRLLLFTQKAFGAKELKTCKLIQAPESVP